MPRPRAPRRGRSGTGTIRQRSPHSWQARYTAPDGKQHSISAPDEATCRQRLAEALMQIAADQWRAPTRMTCAQWFDLWLSDYLPHTTPSTRRLYEQKVRIHFNPAFGSVRLSALSPVHIARMISRMTAAGYKPSTIRHTVSTLHNSLAAAVESGILRDNPADTAKLPRQNAQSFTVIDAPMFPAFIAAARETSQPHALPFLLMTGLRAGELCGLQWSDVDFDAGTLSVQRQLAIRSRCAAPTFSPPKDNEQRVIILPPAALAVLRQQRAMQLSDRLAAGNKWHDLPDADMIFRTHIGTPLHREAIRQCVRRAGIAIGLPDLTTHDLRHSYAVAALRSGADVKTVQHNLGHASAAMTLDVYAAYTTDAGTAAAQKLHDYLQTALIPPV